MSLRLFSFLMLICIGACGKILSFDELKDKPSGLAKDYYINRLINETSPTKAQVQELSKDVFRRAGAVQSSIDKILPPKPHPSLCPKVTVANILDANTTCQNTITTISFSLKLTADVRAKLAEKLTISHPAKAKMLLSLNSENPAIVFANNGETDKFLALFNASSTIQKEKFFATDFSGEFMDKLYSQKGFTTFLNKIVINKSNTKFRQNLLKISPLITSENDAFILGINAITLLKESRAAEFFKRAKETYKRQFYIDNATFWLYLINKDESFLNELANSTDINIYSLFAKDFVHSKPFEIIVPNPTEENVRDFDITDPFLWQKTAENIKNLTPEQAKVQAKKFYAKDSIGIYVYFMQRATEYKNHYFIMPVSPELRGLNPHRSSLIFALARQESLFLPSVISTSYALGTMQFMPFLANAIGKKELKIPNFDQDDMFKPEIAYKFANHHLNYLEKFLQHPLFVAYAYNGGIGFTKKMLLRDDMFRDGKFEPFLSMELVPLSESRLYGKKVLANYVIYRSLTRSNIKISQLFETLTIPALTDKFRK
ncbi:lytic transglycosylase domain-containing protein [Campylobacter sp. faydin G-140]|uniref:lytic transglycosylase domain-containing protein n=1 Tax=Campylobacter anatolicus TaxID=2829105 RepID=UPI001BA2321F|nr:lytic transglycosylase domain-containing protein [Campylobacter anatolicus]MBR8465677.1 lytic transglycosylase domain-containing protein [Campylobacter anatolicus]